MKRLRFVTVIVFLAICGPVFFLGWTSLERLRLEERAELTFFCTSLLDRIDTELETFLAGEEERRVHEYLTPGALVGEPGYVLARAEVPPQGEITISIRPDSDPGQINVWRTSLRTGRIPEVAPKPLMDARAPLPSSSLESKYFASSPKASPLPRTQQTNILRKEKAMLKDDSLAMAEAMQSGETKGFQDTTLVEVEPFQIMLLDNNSMFVFRRVLREDQLLRQGLIIDTARFLNTILDQTYRGQPIADFAAVKLLVRDNGQTLSTTPAGEDAAPVFTLERTMHRPFQFLHAQVAGLTLPPSPARMGLIVSLLGLTLALSGGFAALLRGAWLVEREARRRAGFVSSVTHELKTPLANIRLYMEMLEQGMAADPECERRYYATVFSESDRLSRLISNILEFSRLESRTRALALELADPAPVLDRVRDILSPQAEQAGFTLRLSATPCHFVFDQEALLQTLLNLVENSIKFGRTGPEKIITLSSSLQGQNAVIEISDTGPGIPEKDLQRIFDDFYRCEDELTRTTTGTGIGLALVRRFVLAMDGKVHVRNNPGPGCTFTLTFPAGHPAAGKGVTLR